MLSLPNDSGAVAAYHLGNEKLFMDVKKSPMTAAIPDKLKALLAIAGKVQEGGKSVRAKISHGLGGKAPRTWKFTTGC